MFKYYCRDVVLDPHVRSGLAVGRMGVLTVAEGRARSGNKFKIKCFYGEF